MGFWITFSPLNPSIRGNGRPSRPFRRRAPTFHWRPPAFHWDPRFLLQTPRFLLETQKNDWRPQIFFGDQQIFFGDIQIFIWYSQSFLGDCFSNFNIVATQCRRSLIFQTINAIWSNNVSLKYQRRTPFLQKLNLWQRLNSFVLLNFK